MLLSVMHEGLAMRCILLTAIMLLATGISSAQSTVDETDRFSWAANAGWIDWRADGTNGALFGQQTASGYLYAANFGWIHLGDGSPESGVQYGNDSATDYGVNADSTSDPDAILLSGYAWSANMGWINFNTAGFVAADQPRIEKSTGTLRGAVWSANAGWIRLDSPGVALVRTTLPFLELIGDYNGDGLVTPLDAQDAFACYLDSLCPPVERLPLGDVFPDTAPSCVGPEDGDGAMTPGDSNRLFGLYLGSIQPCP